ncbi:hypothetical protein AEQU2_00077 [Aequorivita lipolytica]|nr:hypothetical protein AEQU2_00077 [Aequorivita lipolytica]
MENTKELNREKQCDIHGLSLLFTKSVNFKY